MNRKKSVRFTRPGTESKVIPKGFNSSAPRLVTTTTRRKLTTTSPFSVPPVKSTRTSLRSRIPASFIRSDYAFKGSPAVDRVSLDHPEIIKDKAKKLVSELKKKNIILNDVSIEKIIRGDPKEYIQVFKRLFTVHGYILKSLKHSSTKSCTELMSKLDGKINTAVVTLFAILSQKLGIKPSLNAGQFLQHRFTVQKLVLCIEATQRLSYHRNGNGFLQNI